MTTPRICCLILATLGFGFVLPVSHAASDDLQVVDEKQPEPAEMPDVALAPPDLRVYRPPPRGKPRVRVPGGTRGPAQGWPAFTALVPEHTAHTASERPSLFWYVAEALPSDTVVMFVLQDEESDRVLVEEMLPTPEAAGIQRIDLGQFEVKLRSGTEYKWSVELLVAAEQRDSGALTQGYIERVETPSELANLSDPSAWDLAYHGLWYDALAAFEDGIRSDPADTGLRRALDELLRQAGLEAATSAPGD